MGDQNLEDLEGRIQPTDAVIPPPSEENTERYFEILKRFIRDAKNAKTIGVPGAEVFWEKMHLDDIADAIESVEGAVNQVNRTVLIGKVLGQAVMDSRPDAARFQASREATAAGAAGGDGHSNPDFGGAAASAFGQAPGRAWDDARLKFSNAVDDLPGKLSSAFLQFKYRIKHHDYPGGAEEALEYFAKAKSYYDAFTP